jgi:hypothetical protein
MSSPGPGTPDEEGGSSAVDKVDEVDAPGTGPSGATSKPGKNARKNKKNKNKRKGEKNNLRSPSGANLNDVDNPAVQDPEAVAPAPVHVPGDEGIPDGMYVDSKVEEGGSDGVLEGSKAEECGSDGVLVDLKAEEGDSDGVLVESKLEEGSDGVLAHSKMEYNGENTWVTADTPETVTATPAKAIGGYTSSSSDEGWGIWPE